MKIFDGKKFKIFQKQKSFSISQIHGSKSCFVLFQLLIESKNLMGSCESSWNDESKIGILFVSTSNTFRENEKKCFYQKKLGFIDVLRTVAYLKSTFSRLPKISYITICRLPEMSYLTFKTTSQSILAV